MILNTILPLNKATLHHTTSININFKYLFFKCLNCDVVLDAFIECEWAVIGCRFGCVNMKTDDGISER